VVIALSKSFISFTSDIISQIKAYQQLQRIYKLTEHLKKTLLATALSISVRTDNADLHVKSGPDILHL